jgi:hypothetical protein
LRKIELSRWESFPRRVESLKRSLEIIYEVRLTTSSEDLPLDRLFPTEDFLENDKLALVFMKIVTEGYDVPIIAVERSNDYFILDGHHRVFIHRKFKEKTIKAEVLKFSRGTSYRNIEKSSIEDLPFKEIGSIDDPIVKAWGRILNIMKQYEALYHMHFYMKKKQVALFNLSPTQPEVLKTQIDGIRKLIVPIVCLEFDHRYFILDGHARCLRAKQTGLKSIQSIVLQPQIPVNYGIVKTAREMKLQSLNDIAITEFAHTST